MKLPPPKKKNENRHRSKFKRNSGRYSKKEFILVKSSLTLLLAYSFFSIKLSNLHYTNKQRAYSIEIKNIKRNYYTCTEPYEPLQKS